MKFEPNYLHAYKHDDFHLLELNANRDAIKFVRNAFPTRLSHCYFHDSIAFRKRNMFQINRKTGFNSFVQIF